MLKSDSKFPYVKNLQVNFSAGQTDQRIYFQTYN